MLESTRGTLRFGTSVGLPLEGAFDAGRLTSDGGLPWVGEADRALGLCDLLAACIPEWRQRVVRHSLATLVRQRVYQIACGYEDQNDADTLRSDPLLKLACGRRPVSGADLASQPTFSRLENAVDRHAIEALARALVAVYIRERGRGGPPRQILLDLDGTDDPAHGEQEGVAYHGYYRQHMYHPLLVFDGDTGHLITAVLRPGNVHASRFVVLVLRRLLRVLRAAWPAVTLELRADSGFAVPRLYAWCEANAVTYTIGLIPNAVLEALAAPLLEEARARSAEQGGVEGPPRRRGPVSGQVLAPPAPGRLQGRGAGQGTEHPLRRHHPRRRPPRALRLLRRSRRARRTGSRTSRTPSQPTASATTASGPTPSACCSTPPPSGCSTPSAAGSPTGSPPPTSRPTSSTPSASASSRSADGSASSPTASASPSPPATPASPSGSPSLNASLRPVNNPG